MENLHQLEITDATINHPVPRLETFRSVRQHKRYGAIVWRDKSKPGGLGRKFLETREHGYIVMVDQVKEGDYLELTAKIEVYATTGRQVETLYFYVVKKTASAVVVERVKKEEILPLDQQEEMAKTENPYFGADPSKLSSLLEFLEEITPKISDDPNLQEKCRGQIDQLKEGYSVEKLLRGGTR